MDCDYGGDCHLEFGLKEYYLSFPNKDENFHAYLCGSCADSGLDMWDEPKIELTQDYIEVGTELATYRV